MAVLVTGITGFLGSHLGRHLLAQGEEVHAIIRPGACTTRIDDYRSQVHVIEGDLHRAGDWEQRVAQVRPARTFHLAWSVEPGRFWTSPENLDCVEMTLSLARRVADAGCEMWIGAGTCAEYAWEHGFLSEESTPTGGHSLYAVAKDATRSILQAWSPTVGMKVAWPRFFFPFGPGEPAPRLIPSVILALLRGERPACSHGMQIRDFVSAQDCASALCAIAESDLSGAVNVGTGEPTRIRTLVETLAGLVGRSAADVDFGAIPAPPGDPPMVVADPRRLHSTGWRPARSLDAALAETVDWWKKNA